jgi:hypothetical protein
MKKYLLGTIFYIIGYRKTKNIFYLFVQLGEAFINCGNLARIGTIFAVWLQPIFG